MGRRVQDTTTRACSVLVGLLAVALTASLSLDSSAAVSAAVLTLLVATLAHPGHPLLTRACCPAVTPTTTQTARPGLASHVTDPVHHPRRPRAPGTA